MVTIAIDFDGVIHRYGQGFQDGTIYDEPMPGALAGIRALLDQGHAVYIHSARDAQSIVEWLRALPHCPFEAVLIPAETRFWRASSPGDVVGVSNRKLPALIYLDDRAITFTTWPLALDMIERTVWEKGAAWQSLETTLAHP